MGRESCNPLAQLEWKRLADLKVKGWDGTGDKPDEATLDRNRRNASSEMRRRMRETSENPPASQVAGKKRPPTSASKGQHASKLSRGPTGGGATSSTPSTSGTGTGQTKNTPPATTNPQQTTKTTTTTTTTPTATPARPTPTLARSAPGALARQPWVQRFQAFATEPDRMASMDRKVQGTVYVYSGGESLSRLYKEDWDVIAAQWRQKLWAVTDDDMADKLMGGSLSWAINMGCGVIRLEDKDAIPLCRQYITDIINGKDGLKAKNIQAWDAADMPKMVPFAVNFQREWKEHFGNAERFLEVLKHLNKIKKGYFRIQSNHERPDGGEWLIVQCSMDIAALIMREGSGSLALPGQRIPFLYKKDDLPSIEDFLRTWEVAQETSNLSINGYRESPGESTPGSPSSNN